MPWSVLNRCRMRSVFRSDQECKQMTYVEAMLVDVDVCKFRFPQAVWRRYWSAARPREERSTAVVDGSANFD